MKKKRSIRNRAKSKRVQKTYHQKDILFLRSKIDAFDNEIANLLLRRLKIANKILLIKKAKRMPARDSVRENSIIVKALQRKPQLTLHQMNYLSEILKKIFLATLKQAQY